MATLATCLISVMKTKEKEIEVLDEARLLVEVADKVLPLVAVHEADGVVVEAVAAGRVVPRVAVPALDGFH